MKGVTLLTDKFQPNVLDYRYHIIAMEKHYNSGMVWGNDSLEDLCKDFFDWMQENGFDNNNLRYADIFDSDKLKHLYSIEIYKENKILLNPVEESNSVNPAIRVFILKIKFRMYAFIAKIISTIIRFRE